MKRIYTLIILSLLTIAVANAQIIVTNAAWPKAGDTMKVATDDSPSYVLVPAQATNGNWDFSSLKKDTKENTVFFNANLGANFASFPTSDLYANTGMGEAYFNVTTNVFESLGLVGDIGGFGFPLVAKIKPSQIERRNPMKYFDINNNDYSFGATFGAGFLPDSLFSGLPIKPDSIRFGQSTSRQDVVDSWGKLTIPGGTYDVLREKRTSLNTFKLEVKLPIIGWFDVSSSFGGGLGADTTVTYSYIANGSAEPIMVLNCNATGDTINSVDFKNNKGGVGIFTPNYPVTKLNVYPNPASSFVKIECLGLDSGESSLSICNILGQSVRQEKAMLSKEDYIWQLNLNDMLPGLYFVAIRGKDGLLKASGTFTISK